MEQRQIADLSVYRRIKFITMQAKYQRLNASTLYSAFNLEEPLFIPRVVFVVSPHNFLHSPFYCINADCNYEHEKMQDTRCSTALSH